MLLSSVFHTNITSSISLNCIQLMDVILNNFAMFGNQANNLHIGSFAQNCVTSIGFVVGPSKIITLFIVWMPTNIIFLIIILKPLYHRFPSRKFGNTFGYLDKFCAPYPTMPIFSNGHDFGHSGPFGRPTIIRSLIETNCMKLASGNLSLI